MRSKEEVIAELRAVVKEITTRCDTVKHEFAFSAVLESDPKLRRRLHDLGKEAEAMGITAEELK